MHLHVATHVHMESLLIFHTKTVKIQISLSFLTLSIIMLKTMHGLVRTSSKVPLGFLVLMVAIIICVSIIDS